MDTLVERPSCTTVTSAPRRLTIKSLLLNIPTQVSSFSRIEKFHIFVNYSWIQVCSQVFGDSLTYQVVEISSYEYATWLSLFFIVYKHFRGHLKNNGDLSKKCLQDERERLTTTINASCQHNVYTLLKSPAVKLSTNIPMKYGLMSSPTVPPSNAIVAIMKSRRSYFMYFMSLRTGLVTFFSSSSGETFD